MENAWDEIHKGADMQVPKIYKFIIKYITPLFLFLILGIWFWQEWLPIIFMKHISSANRTFILGTRIGLLLIFLILAIMVNIAWRRKRRLRNIK
jgi:pilus assembly protein TadC